MIETVIVESNWRDALGNPISGSVQITPIAEFVTSSGSGSFRISGSTVFASIVNGAFSVSLIPTDDATPAGQYYSVRTFIGGIQHVTAWIVPTTSAVLSIADVEVSPPPPIPILSSGDAISLRGLSIKAALSPADGYVLTWVAANNRFETLAAAVSGAPAAATFITQTPHAGLSAEQALSSLATGLLKNATGTGELSVAVPGTDFEVPLGYTPLDPDNDLSDVADAPTARTNLGLGDAATKNTGAIAGTVAAGDDVRLSDARPPSGNAGGNLGGTYPNPTISFPAAPVASVFGRTGAVVAAVGDYAVSQLGDFITTRTSATQLTVANGVLNGSVVGGTVDLTAGAGDGTLHVYWNENDETVHVWGEDLDSTKITGSVAITVDPDSTAYFFSNNVALWDWVVTSDAYDVGGGSDVRGILGQKITGLSSASLNVNANDIPGSYQVDLLPDSSFNSVTTAALTVATLPGSPSAGQRAFVTDSDAVSFTAGIGAVVVGSGSTAVPVVFDGTNWRVG